MKKVMFLLPWLSLSFLGLGMYLGFCSSYSYPAGTWSAMVIMFLMSGMISFVVLQLKKNWVWAGTAAFIFLAVVIAGIYGKHLQADGQTLLYYVNQKSISYSGRSIVSGKPEISAFGDGKMLLYYICGIVALYAAFFGFRERWKLFGMLPFFCGAFSGVPVGKMPGKQSMICLLAGTMWGLFWMSFQEKGGSASFKQKNERPFEGNLRICFLLAAILSVGICFAEMLTDSTQKMVLGNFESYLKKQHQIENTAKGYIAQAGRLIHSYLGLSDDGNLSNDSPHYTNKVVMQVTVEERPEQSIYLKGYVGNQYNMGKWTSVDKKENDWLQQSRKDAEKFWSQGYMGLSGAERVFEDMYSQKMRIKCVGFGKWNRYAHIPYFSDIQKSYEEGTKNSPFTLLGDYSVKKEANRYEIPFYCIGQSAQWQLENAADSWQGSSGDYNDVMGLISANNYSRYVEREYRKMPKKGLSRLQSFVVRNREDLMADSQAGTMHNVRNLLKKTASYGKKLDAVPDDEDYIEYFLFTQKKGFCEHFATAGTLILRACGIPARYVSGYCVGASAFKQNLDGTYTAKVRDSDAHAWTEVYSDTLGWIPAEMTPGIGGTQERRLRKRTHAEEMGMNKYATNSWEPQHGSAKDTDEDRTKYTKKKQVKKDKKMPDALSCLMGILLIVFLYVVVSRVRHWFQRMKKKLLRSRTGEYIRYDVRLLVAFLRKCGIPKISKMNDIEWLREVMYQSPAMFVENDLLKMNRIIQKAYFAEEDITDEEYQFYCMFSQRIRLSIFVGKNAFRRWMLLLTGDYKRVMGKRKL